MATDLGKAYVQIMPSAQGIKKQVETVLGKELDGVGESTGKQFGKKLLSGMDSLGKNLTKFVTAPALGAATAVAGVVSALGFRRLTGMDTARAKLQGLGFEGKQLDQIMQNARNAVQGTTFATADGAYVAAGALAAGVKEGAELERYIKLVGDAAIGANAPIEEMAQIFDRVTSEGKLTRNELEMINYRLPGFSNAMMEHVGAGSREAFNEMLRAGEVSSADMLDVMESYAGGMSEAYANTWSGLKDNVIANIGIIGEALLEGLFEDGKAGMAEFLEFLRESDGLKEWATETGEKLRESFQKIVEVIKTVIDWWTGLSSGVQKFIGIVTAVLVAIGPIIMAFTKIASTIMTLMPLFKALGAVIGAITSPVGLVVAAIIGAVALIYIYWEPIKEFFINLWESITEAFFVSIEFIKNLIETVMNHEITQEIIETLTVWKEWFLVAWEYISGVIRQVVDFIKKIVGAWLENKKNQFNKAMEFIKKIIDVVWPYLSIIIEDSIERIKTIISIAMDFIKTAFQVGWELVKGIVVAVLRLLRGDIRGSMQAIRGTIENVMGLVSGFFSRTWDKIRNTFSNSLNRIRSLVSDGLNRAYQAVTNVFGRFRDAGRRIVQSIADGIRGAIGTVTGAISNVAQTIRNFLPFSPPKIGPMKDIMDVDWGGTIAGGIEKGESDIEKAMNSVLNFDLPQRARYNNPNQNIDNWGTSQQPQPIILQVDGHTFAQIMGDYTSAEGGNRIRKIERGLA